MTVLKMPQTFYHLEKSHKLSLILQNDTLISEMAI